ncbi:ankyrin repeat domain-containing protein, partial [Patescibacteria group bacterium]|nr:ankyrin repeat domain-containing protein [Patescibacteria group bacterium]
ELFLLFYKNMGNVNVQDNDGRSLIFYALDTYIGSDNFDLFVLDKILFTENIDINIQDNKGNTALNTLLLSLEQEGYSTDELYDYEKYKIKSLLIAGSDIEVKNNDGNSSKIIAKRMDNKEIQDLLENQKNLINTENRMGKTPLLIACLQGYTEKVEWLISKGSYVDTENKCHKIQRGIDLYDTFTPTYEDTIKPKFYTALMVAQNIEIVKALIKAGADINKKNADGNTALMVYAKNNWFEGVERLITAGANTNLVNNFYETALIIAKKNCKSKTTHYKEPEKLFYFLLERTTKKFIPSILSPLFSLFKNKQ